jgi:hypothetical protein
MQNERKVSMNDCWIAFENLTNVLSRCEDTLTQIRIQIFWCFVALYHDREGRCKRGVSDLLYMYKRVGSMLMHIMCKHQSTEG